MKDIDKLKEGLSLPVYGKRLGHRLLEEILEELELRDEARGEAAQHVEQQLDLVHVVPMEKEKGLNR